MGPSDNTHRWDRSLLAGIFASFYRELEDNRYYIKFDDDIMYIRRGTIEAMLHEKLQKRYWMVSANVINHPGEGHYLSIGCCHNVFSPPLY